MSRSPLRLGCFNCEVCIVGGGPAGATLAWRLATLGREVCLVERSSAAPQRLSETVSPAFIALTGSLGMDELVERGLLCTIERPDVIWSAPAPGSRRAPVHVLERGCFDEGLRACAARAGVRLMHVTRGSPRVERNRDGWTIELESAGGSVQVATAFLVEARGRRARLAGRMRRMSAATAAISGRWRAISPPAAGIEACEHGWLWGLPLPSGEVGVTAFVDSARCGGRGRALLDEFYRTMLARSKLYAGLCAGQLMSPVEVCDASALVHDDPAGDGWLRVGEASFALDPLSSQGVQAAIGSALQASAVVYTILACPDDAAMAMAFYRERQGRAAARHAAWAARLYADQDQVARGDFWSARSAHEPLSAVTEYPPGEQTLNLRSIIRRSPALVLHPRPVISRNRVCMAVALDHPGLEEPFAYFGDVAVAPLLEDLETARPLAELLHRWERRVPMRLAQALFLQLWRAGALIAAGPEYARSPN